jgi:predicted ABC-type ATPase
VPTFIVLGGPNGAGKSTAAPAVLRDYLGVLEFVNADTVAQGLSGFSPDRAAVGAGRIVLQRVQDLVERGGNFALESTLSGRSLAGLLRAAQSRGYRVHLVYLWIPSVEASIQRVEERVRMGGHNVPLSDLQRRYRRSVRNFLELYRPLADRWDAYENSGPAPLLVARGSGHTEGEIWRPSIWRRLLEAGGHGPAQDDL